MATSSQPMLHRVLADFVKSDLLSVHRPGKDDTSEDAQHISELQKSLADSFGKGRHIFGAERCDRAKELLHQSNVLAKHSMLCAAGALRCLTLPDHSIPHEGDDKNAYRSLLRDVRDAVVWRAAAKELGLDSKPALCKSLNHAASVTGCGITGFSQLKNAAQQLRKAFGYEAETKNATLPSEQDTCHCCQLLLLLFVAVVVAAAVVVYCCLLLFLVVGFVPAGVVWLLLLLLLLLLLWLLLLFSVAVVVSFCCCLWWCRSCHRCCLSSLLVSCCLLGVFVVVVLVVLFCLYCCFLFLFCFVLPFFTAALQLHVISVMSAYALHLSTFMLEVVSSPSISIALCLCLHLCGVVVAVSECCGVGVSVVDRRLSNH